MRKLTFLLIPFILLAASFADIITVAPDGSADFTTIQAAINAADPCDTVLVADGTYTGTGNRDIDFLGKAITVRSENGPTNCIINCDGSESEPHRAFIFSSGEGPNSMVEGFTITGGYADLGGGIKCTESAPIIINCVFRNNWATQGGGIELYAPMGNTYYTEIVNCTFSNNAAEPNSNGGAIFVSGNSCGSPPSERVQVNNCIIWGNSSDLGLYATPKTAYHATLTVEFSILQSDWNSFDEHTIAAESCITADPCFADPCNGDFHLMSEEGRWDPCSLTWVMDSVTSPAIDAGDPDDDPGDEPAPNGCRINMGAYGGTSEASKDAADCFDQFHFDWQEWVDVGSPCCWCCPYQCYGDGDCLEDGDPKQGYYQVGHGDLGQLVASWKNDDAPGFTICADYSRSEEGSKCCFYRVGYTDLGILVSNWKDDTDLAADCGGSLQP